ncbi:MAG TPA: GYD domain-containing protein [Gammaproteobacteria bacterium]|nr:GYD domain-containing protein [Gammaproteobacteria bacterium]
MGYYLLQLNYTPQGWAALVKNPQNRLQALAPVVQRLEGDIVNGWMQFGDYDVLVVCQLPEHVSAAALSMAISAGGAVGRVKTTPLITFEEGIESLRKAAGTQYTPPESEFAYFGT